MTSCKTKFKLPPRRRNLTKKHNAVRKRKRPRRLQKQRRDSNPVIPTNLNSRRSIFALARSQRYGTTRLPTSCSAKRLMWVKKVGQGRLHLVCESITLSKKCTTDWFLSSVTSRLQKLWALPVMEWCLLQR